MDQPGPSSTGNPLPSFIERHMDYLVRETRNQPSILSTLEERSQGKIRKEDTENILGHPNEKQINEALYNMATTKGLTYASLLTSLSDSGNDHVVAYLEERWTSTTDYEKMELNSGTMATKSVAAATGGSVMERPISNQRRRNLEITTVGIRGLSQSVVITGNFNTVMNVPSTYAAEGHKKEIPLWFNVEDPIESFCGRELFLQNMHTQIQAQRLTILSQVQVISGLGGVGKTEAARMYIKKFGSTSSYHNVIWIDSENKSSLQSSFTRLAERLGVRLQNVDGEPKGMDQILDDIYTILCTHDTLIVFDNADNMASSSMEDNSNKNGENIQNYLPSKIAKKYPKKPFVLVTSRNRNWPAYSGQILFLDVLQKEEGVQFILKELQLESTNQNVESALQLATLLGHLPLALKHAVAYICKEGRRSKFFTKKFTIQNYMKAISKDYERLKFLNLPPHQHLSTTAINVFKTWNLTFEKLEEAHKEVGSIAIQIVEVLSFLSADNVHGDLLLAIVTDQQGQPYDGRRLGNGLLLLEDYGIISQMEEGEYIKIHRQVQYVIFEFLKVANALAAILNSILGPCLKYLDSLAITHQTFSSVLRSFSSIAEKFDCVPDHHHQEEEFEQFKIKLASRYQQAGIFEDARELIQQVYDREGRLYGKKNEKKLLTLIHLLGDVLQDQGKYAEAYTLYEKAHCDRLALLGHSHIDTMTSELCLAKMFHAMGRYGQAKDILDQLLVRVSTRQNFVHFKNQLQMELAMVLRSQGNYDASLQIFKIVCQYRENFCGHMSESTMQARQEMALVLQNQSKYPEAMTSLENVYQFQCSQLGQRHVATLRTQADIAVLNQLQGNYDQALASLKMVFDEQKSILGKNHPDTMTTQHSIGVVYLIQGKYGKAMTLFDEVYDLRNNFLGPEHPHTMATLQNQAIVKLMQGKFHQATTFLTKAWTLQCQIQGSGHPDTLRTRENMVTVLQESGKYEEAVGMLEEILKARETTSDASGHVLDVLATKQKLAQLLLDQGKFVEAMELSQNVLKLRKNILKHQHPDVLQTTRVIAIIHGRQGNHGQALALLKECLEDQKIVLGTHHPAIMTGEHEMALLLSKLEGRQVEALQMAKDACDKQRQKLGQSHPDTMTGLFNVALILDQQGKFEEAMEIYEEVHRDNETNLGDEHPTTLRTKYRIGLLLKNQGKILEARGHLEKVCEVASKIFSFQNPIVVEAMQSLEMVLRSLGHFEEAKKWNKTISTGMEKL